MNINNKLAVVIMAAGKGTRMQSDLPKVLHKVGGKPMISHVIHTAKELNASRIIAIIGHEYKLVEETLKNENIEFAYQFEQKGTGHAVDQCRTQLKDFDGDVLVLSGDVPLLSSATLNQLITVHQDSNATASLLTADFEDPTGYGRVIRSSSNSLEKIVEHKDASNEILAINEINAGIYVFNSKILFELLPQVNNQNVQQEYYLPDVIPLILFKKGIVSIDKTKNNLEIQGVNTIEQLRILDEKYFS
jgi:UDP-N-acetylglucosamine diphosphorylase/glucosamine-1-phosphate N-acetyltransferase